jgi:hypothetical protein
VLFAMLAVCNDGDEVLVVEPFYTNYLAFSTMAGVRLVAIAARGEDGFHLPPRAAFERVLSPRTRALVLCNPNNPTGTVYTRGEIEAMAGFCSDHGLFLISDEVYREFVYDGREAVSALVGRFRGSRDPGRQPVEALHRAAAPGLPGNPQPRRPPGGAAHGAGAPLAPRPGAARGDRLGRARTRLLRRHRARVPGTARRPLRRAVADPRRLPAGRRGLYCRPAADRRRRDFARFLLAEYCTAARP